MSVIRRWQLLPPLWAPLAVVALCLPAPSLAQDPHKLIEPSPLLLTVQTPSKNPPGPPDTYPANGFLVSDDGLVLTSYSVLSQAQDTANSKIWVQLDGGQIEATVVLVKANFNLLLLQMLDIPQALQRAKLDPSFEITPDTPIHASGYDTGAEGDRKVWSWNGVLDSEIHAAGESKFPIADVDFSESRVGSPVYNDSGYVIGIMAGNSHTFRGKQAIIPIKYAESLIPHVRVRDMAESIRGIRERLPDDFNAADLDKKVRALEELIGVLRTYEWEIRADPQKNTFSVAFKRAIGGEPRLTNVAVHVQPYAQGNTLVTPIQKSVPLAPSKDDRHGEVDLPEVFTRITAFEGSTPDKIINATVEIKGTLSNNDELPAVSLCYKIEETNCPEPE